MTETLMPAVEPESRHVFTASFRGGMEASRGGNDPTLVGHGVVFNSWSEPLHTGRGSFRERIAEGALDGALREEPDVRLLFDHAGVPLGRTKSGTMELRVDDDGLRVWSRIHPSRTDILSALERGDIDQMSFAFSDIEDEWQETDDPDMFERTITRIGRLYDVSLVTFPAYPDTDAALRDLRSAADAGKITLPKAGIEFPAMTSIVLPSSFTTGISSVTFSDSRIAAQDGPAGTAANGDTDNAAQDEPADEPVNPLAALRESAQERTQRERESYLRLLKEITRP